MTKSPLGFISGGAVIRKIRKVNENNFYLSKSSINEYFFRKLIIFILIISYVYLFDCPPLPLSPSCQQVVCVVLEFLNNYTHKRGFVGNILLYSVRISL